MIMNLISYKIHACYETSGVLPKIIVLAALTGSSKKMRLFWLMFNWDDDQKKIFGILQKHWKIAEPEMSDILKDIELLKNDPTLSIVITKHVFSTQKQSIQIMTEDGSGQRLILSSLISKKLHECKPSDKRWTRISNRLDPMKYSSSSQNDLLNMLGCSIPKDRLELIEQINLFYDNIKS